MQSWASGSRHAFKGYGISGTCHIGGLNAHPTEPATAYDQRVIRARSHPPCRYVDRLRTELATVSTRVAFFELLSCGQGFALATPTNRITFSNRSLSDFSLTTTA